MQPNELTRRSFTTLTGLAALGGVTGLASHLAKAASPQSSPDLATAPRALRLAHFTDLHITPKHRAEEGMKCAFETAHADGIEMILTGGDLVMDSFATSREQVALQWALFHKVFAEHCKVSVEHCLGNHDVFGWCKSKSNTTGTEDDHGYARALAELKLASRWRSFDRAGWHFVVLSSVERDPADECGYLAYLNDAQRAWLEADLKATTLPTVVVSHVPIVTITPALRGESSVKAQTTEISGGLVHLDASELHGVFRRSGRVRLVLSGHTHLVDRCVADGVTYACSGAVCGGWWKRTETYCDPCYALIDLMRDGSFDYTLKPTGWKNA